MATTQDKARARRRLAEQRHAYALAVSQWEKHLALLEELRDDLPVGHHERPGVIRAIEVLRHDGRPG